MVLLQYVFMNRILISTFILILTVHYGVFGARYSGFENKFDA